MNAHLATGDSTRFDVARIRADFPALAQRVHGKPLVYLDSAATALKPQAVIDAVTSVYAADCANIHRAVHTLSQRATKRYEDAREKARAFMNAASIREVVFVRGATEGVNLVAQSWGRSNLREGDEIVLTELEHHSNIVPWQLVAAATGAKVRVVPITDEGEVPLAAFEGVIGERTKLVSVAQASNALGTVLPLPEVIALAHAAGAKVLVDGAQGAPHLGIDGRKLGCDFYVWSGHKVDGPTGIGVLYAREALLDAMPPWQGGGDMIDEVRFEGTTWNELPYKFEAGTPHIAGVIGLGAALDYVSGIGLDAIVAHEQALLRYATAALDDVPGLRIVGRARSKVGVVSFTLEGAHPTDVGTIVDTEGVAIRTGHHCAQPVLRRFGLSATARASFGLYNSTDDVDALVRALAKVRELFR